MHRLLIANRGEIARRIIRTAHRMGIETVAVFSEADAQALHVREATVAQALGGQGSAESYLRIDKLLAAARASGADAIHPGYGFLSENAGFAEAVLGAGLTWVGPPPAAIHALGSKSSAKQLAQRLGVPCLPGYQGADQSDDRLTSEASRIGYPLMVKAAAGGGGRGMRLVTDPALLRRSLAEARSEAKSSFGSAELLIERALLNPRHVEVQVFADAQGRCIHLGERDCSVQRRHQKLIEETPSPAVDDALRERMTRCAMDLARAAGYVGAGTVEFLVEGGEFYLMEMNTRLQVEHAVTEAVTGLDLVEWQLRVARGEGLPLAQDQVRFSGHAIEARLCAEDDQFRPHTGTVLRWQAPGTVRVDHAIFEGLEVSAHYDSMLGKLVAHASTRQEAVDQLAFALDRTSVLGLPTNRRLLAACLRHSQFQAGQALIPFLAEQGHAIREALQKEEHAVRETCAVAALLPDGAAPVLPNPFERPLRVRHRDHAFYLRLREAEAVKTTECACAPLANGRWHVQAGGIDLFLDDLTYQPASTGTNASVGVDLRAPFNGKVIAVKASPGATVARGQTLFVIESMKLEHAVAAPRDGVVQRVLVEAGQQAATSQVLLTFEAAA